MSVLDRGEYGDKHKPLTQYARIELARAIAVAWGEYLEKMPPQLQNQLLEAISSIRQGNRDEVAQRVDPQIKGYVKEALALSDDELVDLGEGIGCQQGRYLEFDYINS